MSNKHTTGPWTLETVSTSVGICHKVGPFPGRVDGDSQRHACLYADFPSSFNKNDNELLSNARLISAAPELLDALVDCVSLMSACWNEDNPETIKARAAIAKATGA
jgi:hypothetical protein